MKNFMLRLFLTFIIFCLALQAREVVRPQRYKKYENPWTTGPLLAPSVAVVTAGHFNIEPYIYAVANTGLYNKKGKSINGPTLWNNYLTTTVQVGLTSFMDMQIAPSVYYNYFQGRANWEYGDTPITFDFQIVKPHHQDSFVPYVKLVIAETFPSGNFRNLNPQKLGSDVSGAGTYATTVGLAAGELFHIYKYTFLSTRLYIDYTYSAPSHVKGLSIYGGGKGTNAIVYPGNQYSFDAACELTLSKNWVLACDLVGLWIEKARVKKIQPLNARGEVAKIGRPSSRQFSLAPAIEYNFSDNVGVISGCWFTFAGRNCSRFVSSLTAVNIYY